MTPSPDESGLYEPPRQRMATPAMDASMRWHYLSPQAAARVGDRWQAAVCGEHHRRWWPLSDFGDPDAFDPCPECLRLVPHGR